MVILVCNTMWKLNTKGFNKLTVADKLKLVKLKGEFIATIGYEQYSVSLYMLDNFLVEKYLDNESKKTIKVSSVEDLGFIKYLPHITITSIYNLIA
jgi:hypothetical protein